MTAVCQVPLLQNVLAGCPQSITQPCLGHWPDVQQGNGSHNKGSWKPRHCDGTTQSKGASAKCSVSQGALPQD